MAKNITTREKDYSKWYQDVIKAGELADHSPTRGCMVIRPTGFALWEAIQADLDRRFKETGHVNAYFPLLIPMNFLAKEAQHVEGFAMECAVVTHSGLEKNPDGPGLRVKSPLEEPYVIRPTSETVIGHMYAEWVQSWRDLPILINQWANVMRWEMRTRLFLRTAEFLWQEGHTAHETAEEAQIETLRMLGVYRDFAESFLAIPVLTGEKTRLERFPGANHTYCIEGLMQDGKALQCGTSHNLGQNFSKAFDIKYVGRDQQIQHAWTTSWGVSTRLIGALIMCHSDDEGLVLPPKVASVLGAIIPIYKSDEERAAVLAFARKLVAQLCGEKEVEKASKYETEAELRVFFKDFSDGASRQTLFVDKRDTLRPGEKHFHWEQRGVPFRFEIGPRDVAAGKVVVKSRLGGDKQIMDLADITPDWFVQQLTAMQSALFERAKAMRDANTHVAGSKDELYDTIKNKGGFVRCFLKEDDEFEARVKADTKATVRLVCDDSSRTAPTGRCIASGEETTREVVFAIAY